MCKKFKIISVILSVSLLGCACGAKQEEKKAEEGQKPVEESSEEQEEEDSRQKCLDAIRPYAYSSVEGIELEPGTYISVIGKSADGDFWAAVEEGAKDAGADLDEALGYKGEDKIKIVYSGPGEPEDVDEQVNILDEELARYPSALAMSNIDTQSCEVQFDLAAMNDIPVVAFDSASGYQGLMAKVGTDNEAAAQTAASRTAEAMKERGKVIVLAHDSVSENGKERTEAFIREIEENHAGISVANTYYLDQLDEKKKNMADEINAGSYSVEQGVAEGDLFEIPSEPVTAEDITDEQVLDYILRRNPDVAAIYATNESAVEAALALCDRMEKKEMVITGFDVNEEIVQALADEKIDGIVMQNPYGMGYAAVVAAARSVLSIGNEAEVDTGYTWVTPEMAQKQEIAY